MKLLTESEYNEAAFFNSARIDNGDLPFPLLGADAEELTAWACYVQAVSGLKVDGLIGPKTLAALSGAGKGCDFKLVASPPRDSLVPDSHSNPSNCIIVNGRRCRLPDEMIAKGYTAVNYLDDGIVRFKHRKRTKALRWFVLHETVGNTAKGCVKSLEKKGFGVQLIQDPYGCFYCHGDLVLDRMVHANHLNNGSFGCEQINPYNPVFVRDSGIFGVWIPRQWWTWVPGRKSVLKLLQKKIWERVPKKYVALTDAQVQSMSMFAPWVCEQTGCVPFAFPTGDLGKRNRKKKWPGAGIVAHRDFSNHSDGRYMLEQLMRMQDEEIL